jgi:small subunit ribosomal protein S4e
MVLRDILNLAKTRKEAKIIISEGKVFIDGIVRREEGFPIGLMDVISIPDANATYRVLSHKNGLIFHPVGEEEATFKLCRIENKTTLDNGQIQLNLHDGTNKLVQVADSENPEEDVYQTLNVLKITIPKGETLEQIKLAKDASALIIGGQNRGIYGKIVDIEEIKGKKRRLQLVTIKDDAGKKFQTILDYIFVLGGSEKSLSFPEVK